MAKRGEKKVFDIPWNREGIEIKVPVRMVTTRDPGEDKEVMTFRAVYGPAGVEAQGNDINKVREEVLKKLDEWYSIQWDLYFLVTVSGDDRGQHDRFEIIYEFEFYVIGKDVRGETRHMRIPRPKNIENFGKEKLVQWSGETPREGMPKTGGKIEDGWNRPTDTRALVRATPQNVAAADKFMGAMKSLMEQMHTHFAPENIDKLLARAVNLLPAPKGEGR